MGDRMRGSLAASAWESLIEIGEGVGSVSHVRVDFGEGGAGASLVGGVVEMADELEALIEGVDGFLIIAHLVVDEAHDDAGKGFAFVVGHILLHGNDIVEDDERRFVIAERRIGCASVVESDEAVGGVLRFDEVRESLTIVLDGGFPVSQELMD